MKKTIENFYTWNGLPDYWYGSALPTLTACIWHNQTGKELKQELNTALNMGEIAYQIENIFNENERQEVYTIIHGFITSICQDDCILFDDDDDMDSDCVLYLSMNLEDLLDDE